MTTFDQKDTAGHYFMTVNVFNTIETTQSTLSYSNTAKSAYCSEAICFDSASLVVQSKWKASVTCRQLQIHLSVKIW